VSISRGGPFFGEHGGTLLSQGLLEKKKISLLGEFSEEFERPVKEGFVNGQLSL
jgi:hypothetical protein